MSTMTLPRRRDWMLPILALLSLVIGGIGYRIDQRVPESTWEGRDFAPGLVPENLTKIYFKKPNKSFSLLRQGNAFVIESLDLAPASGEKVNDLILKLAGAKIDKVLGGRKEWDEFKVGESSSELVLELQRGSSDSLKVYLGKQLFGAGRAARIGGKDEIFLIKEGLYPLESETDYLKRDLKLIDKTKVGALEVLEKGTVISPGKYDNENLLKSLEAFKVARYFRTGKQASEVEDLDWKWQLRAGTQQGIEYVIHLAQKNDKWFVKAMASLNFSIDPKATVVDMKQMTAKADADQFNHINVPWIYEMTSESAEKIKTALSKR